MNIMKWRKTLSIFVVLCMVLLLLGPSTEVFAIGKHVGTGSSGVGSSLTLTVTVNGLESSELPVKITLNREGTLQTVETVNGIATFTTKPSGDCTLSGSPVPGYITPSIKIAIKGKGKDPNPTATLTYEKVPIIPVKEVKLDKEQVDMIIGATVKLTAELLPTNATNKNISWKSSDEDVATVSNGDVSAHKKGKAIITVTTEDGSKIDTCTVIVEEISPITALVDPAPIFVPLKGTVDLPSTVVAEFENGSTKNIDVTWEPKTIDTSETKVITLIGSVDETDLKVELTITVGVAVTELKLDKYEMSLAIKGEEKEEQQLTATVFPTDATIKEVQWQSSNEAVATVSVDETLADNLRVNVKAVNPGSAVITAKTADGNVTAYCNVTVYIDDSPLPTDTYIFAALEDGTTSEHFDEREDVWINGINIPTEIEGKHIEKYYVKVEQKGKDKLLGKGEFKTDIINSDGTVKFNLFKVTNFKFMSKNSKEYFVYMSTDPTYPKDDEKTLKTNFKVGSPIPTGEIIVTTEFVGGDREDLSGVKFILARALYEDDPDHETYSETYEDYLNDSSSNGYTDEVKAWGVTDSTGKIEGFELWNEPQESKNGKWYTKESLKIGGYILLQAPLDGYKTNLDLVNPDSEDGELLKAVHITRDGVETRHIINIFIGDDNESVAVTGIKLDKNQISLAIKGEEKEDQQLTATVFPTDATIKEVQWQSSNEAVATVSVDETLADNLRVNVKAVNPGSAVITAKTVDGNVTAYCNVTVYIDDSPLPTDTYIFAALEDGTTSEHFDEREDVWINGINIPTEIEGKHIEKYYVKVEQKGVDKFLGEGQINTDIINSDGTVNFNLFEITNFNFMSGNSKEYFISMSADPTYPKDDEKTLKTNFKVDSPIPTGEIIVITEFVGGDREDLSGVKFILARALYEDDPDHETYSETYEDYLNDSSSNGYTDEVKAWGVTDSTGKIEGFELWNEPQESKNGKWYTKESLKIGGYILLQAPLDGYKTNLDLVNPDSEDGELLKAVHITSDGVETRHIINIFIGDDNESVAVTGIKLDKNQISLDINDEEKEEQQLTATVLSSNATNKNVKWSSDNEGVATVDNNGLVKAVSEGSTKITAKTVDGGFTDYCIVTVYKSSKDNSSHKSSHKSSDKSNVEYEDYLATKEKIINILELSGDSADKYVIDSAQREIFKMILMSIYNYLP